MSGLAVLGILAAVAAVIALIVVIVQNRQPAAEETPPPPPPKYEVTLYSGGEAVKSFIATQVSSGDSKGYAVAEGDEEYSIFGGSFVVELEGSSKTAVRTPASRYKVTLYSGNKAVRQWYAVHTSSGSGKIYIMPEGATEYTTIGGTFLVEVIA